MDGRSPIFRVATSENWRDKATGERREKTEWHRVVIFNEGLCKVAEQYLKKGAKVYLEGQLQTRKYTDKDGVEKYSTEVVLQGFNSVLTMLDGRSGGGGGGDDFGSDGGSDFGSSGPAPRGAPTGDGRRRRQARHGRRHSVLVVRICIRIPLPRTILPNVGIKRPLGTMRDLRVCSRGASVMSGRRSTKAWQMAAGFVAVVRCLADRIGGGRKSKRQARVSITGCPIPGVTGSCLMIKAANGTVYNISRASRRGRARAAA